MPSKTEHTWRLPRNDAAAQWLRKQGVSIQDGAHKPTEKRPPHTRVWIKFHPASPTHFITHTSTEQFKTLCGLLKLWMPKFKTFQFTTKQDKLCSQCRLALNLSHNPSRSRWDSRSLRTGRGGVAPRGTDTSLKPSRGGSQRARSPQVSPIGRTHKASPRQACDPGRPTPKEPQEHHAGYSTRLPGPEVSDQPPLLDPQSKWRQKAGKLT